MVIDASVATKWFIPEEDSELAIELIAQHQLRAPPLLLTEVGNALWKKLRRGELFSQLDTFARLADLNQTVEIVDAGASALAVRALELALSLSHAIYDCVYLALAEAEEDVLITADVEFRRKVERTDLGRHMKAFG